MNPSPPDSVGRARGGGNYRRELRAQVHRYFVAVTQQTYPGGLQIRPWGFEARNRIAEERRT